jgi:hypothetical protein
LSLRAMAGIQPPTTKLRLLALHSFRTSSKIFQQQVRSAQIYRTAALKTHVHGCVSEHQTVQVRFSGLGKKLEHLVELVPLTTDFQAGFCNCEQWYRSSPGCLRNT